MEKRKKKMASPRQSRVKRVATKHPRKSIATIAGLTFGIVTSACAGFPVASTLRLVCGTATEIVEVVEKVQRASGDASLHATGDASTP